MAIPQINLLQTTVDKFGVPFIGSTSGGGILMPKLKHRFRVIVYSFGDVTSLINVTRQTVSVARPTINYKIGRAHV